jgi:hypothetical protein
MNKPPTPERAPAGWPSYRQPHFPKHACPAEYAGKQTALTLS